MAVTVEATVLVEVNRVVARVEEVGSVEARWCTGRWWTWWRRTRWWIVGVTAPADLQLGAGHPPILCHGVACQPMPPFVASSTAVEVAVVVETHHLEC